MTESITQDNLKSFLLTFIKNNSLSEIDVAKAIGCSKYSLNRILTGTTFPSNEMLKQCGIFIAIGFTKYKKLSSAEKEKISEGIGTIGGGILGFGAISTAVSASGAVVGLSAVGITSGLAAIGTVVGGGMIAGVAVVAAIPLAIGAVGFGLIKGIKSVIGKSKLNAKDFDEYWEVTKPAEQHALV